MMERLAAALMTCSWARRYSAALIAVGVAFALRVALLPALLPQIGDRSAFQTFEIAVLASSLIGGFGPGLLATGTAALLAVSCYLPLTGDLEVTSAENFTRVGLFVSTGLVAAALGEVVRTAQRRQQILQRPRRFAGSLRAAASDPPAQPHRDPTPNGPLTRREREVARLLARGLRNGEIADALFVTDHTVKTHLAHIYSKLGVQTRTQALARFVELGILEEDGSAQPHDDTDPDCSGTPTSPSLRLSTPAPAWKPRR